MPKKKSPTKKRRLRLFHISIFFIISFFAGSVFWYQSRAISNIDETRLVTTLPSDIKNVLGDKIGPHTTAEIPLRIPIFLYHYVEYVKDKNDTIRQSLNIPPNILTQQIETLKEDGYTFITPSDIVRAINHQETLPEKPIVLSFDDGYMDFYTDVFPILKKEEAKAVAYIVPNFLNRPNFMFSYQVDEIAKNPLIEIGAHTMNHVWLSGISEKTAQYEIMQSKKALEGQLHRPVTTFAYPYGAFDQQAIKLAKNAGFANAVSTIPGIEHTQETEFFLYRLRPGYRTGKTLLSFLQQDTFKAW